MMQVSINAIFAAGALYRMWSYYGLANLSAPVHLDNIDCTGTESRLIDCPHLYPVGVTFCGLNEVAGVVCPSMYVYMQQ